MIAFISITTTRTGVLAIGRNAMREVGRFTMHAVALLWWTQFLPFHFMRTAINRYGYKPRAGDFGSGRPFKGSYTQAKVLRRRNGQGVRSIGENRPFVWSGQSRERALSSPNITVKARSFSDYEGRVVINAPTLNFVPNARQEILAGTSDEANDLEQTGGKEWEKQLKRRARSARKTKTFS